MSDARTYAQTGKVDEPLEDIISELPEHTCQVAAKRVGDCWDVTYIVPVKQPSGVA